MIKALIIISILLFIAGCAEIEPPTPDQVMKQPLGPDPLSVGMSKEEVISIWGRPDDVNEIGVSEGVGGTRQEEWIYYPTTTAIPIDKGYLSKARYLYFDGDNLMRIKK